MKYFCLFLVLISSICVTSQSRYKYTVGNGPEDFVLDTFATNPRLIVSCHDRRDKIKIKISYFYSIEIYSKKVQKILRINEPDNFYLSLIGIDLEHLNNKTYLYATSHCEDKYMVVKYELKNDSLFFIKYYTNPLFDKLNDVSVHNGNFIVSNGNLFDGSIVYCDTLGNYKTLIKHINFPNGVVFENDSTFYYSSTIENSFVKNKLQGLNVVSSKKVAKIKGANNIIKSDNNFYITSHPSFFKFLKHKYKSEYKSPIAIYEYNGSKESLRKIYSNDGHMISAASSALIYKNKLFISQLFDDFILQLDFPETPSFIEGSTKK